MSDFHSTGEILAVTVPIFTSMTVLFVTSWILDRKHKHKWDRWSEPFDQPMSILPRMGGPIRKGIDHMQRRTCTTCGQVEERTL